MMNKVEFNKIRECIVSILLSGCSQEPVNEDISLLCKTREGRPYVVSGFHNKESALTAMTDIYERFKHEDNYMDGDECLLLKINEIKK